jgi:hypothetical protein
MDCYSRHRMADILIDLGFPSEDVTAAMNAGPVEHLRRLVGGVPVEVPAKAPDVFVEEPMPPGADHDPLLRAAHEAVRMAQRLAWQRKKGARS